MQRGEFIESTKKLENYYDKQYTTEQLCIMFDELKELSIERYRQIIIQVLKTSKFLPKIADILTIHKEIPYKKQEVVQQKVECSKCNGKGFIIYKKTVKNGTKNIDYEFFARCECKNGLEHSYDGTKIHTNQSKYYVPTISELGL